MNTPETPETKKLAGLAKRLAATCEKAVAETKTGSYTATLIVAAVTVLTMNVKTNTGWG